MGSQKCRIVGKYQSVLMMINPIIFTRTRRLGGTERAHLAGASAAKVEYRTLQELLCRSAHGYHMVHADWLTPPRRPQPMYLVDQFASIAHQSTRTALQLGSASHRSKHSASGIGSGKSGGA
jgi:hypothetical protein